MVRKMMICRAAALFFATALLLLSAVPNADAAEFTASVDRNQVAVGDSFSLSLNVSGASPKTRPDLSVLDQNFTVYGTSQSSQMTFINGKQSSSIGWNVTLMPKKDGALKIPAFTINTDDGKLSSAPITINAVKPSNMVSQNGDNGAAAQMAAVFVHAEINKKNVYQNEPVLLTARLIARKSISDITLPDVKLDNAIVEQQGKPEIYDGLINGERVKVVEIQYLLTPLSAGTLSVPGITFQGQVESGRRQERFGRGIPDPLGMFDNFGFNDYRPFAVSSDAITLNVKAPAAEMTPWLPAQNLKLTETWDGLEKAKVGEPVTRHIRIAASGLAGAALPSLENMIDPQGQFKIYSDKPASGETIDQNNDVVNGWREESYTMIPRQSGDITLPAINLSWWDTESDKIAQATLPAKTIHIETGNAAGANLTAAPQQQTGQQATTPQSAALVTASSDNAEAETTAPQPPSPSHRHLYVIIAALGVAMLGLLGLVAYLLRQLKSHKDGTTGQKQTRTVSKPANEDKVSLTAIKRAGNARELQSVIQRYAHHHWAMPPQSSMQSIAAHLKKHYAGIDTTPFVKLDAILYAGQTEDLETIKNDTVSIIKKIQSTPDRPTKKKINTLNPS